MKNDIHLTRVLVAVALYMFGVLVLGFDVFAVFYGFIFTTFIWVYI